MPNSQDKVSSLENSIQEELDRLIDKMKKPINRRPQYIRQLEGRLRFLQWCNRKVDLWSAPQPKMVKQREVFYCELGQNIGSEQDGKRPVVILQNNVGNAHAKITLVAPITSFGTEPIRNIDGKLFRFEGNNEWKPLDFYDIPIELEEDSKYPIHGVINISQIRVISKSRLAQSPVATITEICFSKVVEAIDKNISIFENNPVKSP